MWSCDLIGGRPDYCNPVAWLRLWDNLKNCISALPIGLDGSNKQLLLGNGKGILL